MPPRALYVNLDGNFLPTSDLPPVRAEDGELLIEVLYSGTNPADLRGPRFLGIRSSVLGNDFCGRILEVPAINDSEFKVGDIVAGYTLTNGERPPRYGSHQQYLAVTPYTGVFKVPKNLPLPDAAALASTVQTANDALFNRLGLPIPSEANGPLTGTLIVWGGGTSVGYSAIQLAREAGVSSIITTSSPSRHDELRSIGATHCFDYNDTNVKAKIQHAIKEANFSKVWAFDAVGLPESSQNFLRAVTGLSKDTSYAFVLSPPGRHPNEQSRGVRHYDISFSMPGGEQTLVEKARPEEGERMWKALEWAVANYGDKFKLPNVHVFEGTADDALEKLEVISGQGSFGKLVFKQPLQ